jgi:hypothetical protein
MTVFSRLFGKKEVAKAAPVQDIPSSPSIDKMTFIEDRHPSDIFREAPIEEKVVERKTILEELLAKEYYSMGKRDGYEEHSLTLMEEHLDIIASDFREAYYKAIQDIDLSLSEMEVYLSETYKEKVPEIYEKIKTKYDQLKEQKKELLLQMDLGAIGEGFIEKSVRLYRAGFRKGFALWSEEELIFKHIKTI